MNQRVRTIIIENGKVLLMHRIKDTKYWVFPGGGLEEGEDHHSALKREAMEELGVEIEIGEKFCEDRCKVNDQDVCHCFYVCKITGGELGTGDGPEWQPDGGYEGIHEIQWRDLSELPNLDVRPNFIRDLVVKEFQA